MAIVIDIRARRILNIAKPTQTDLFWPFISEMLANYRPEQTIKKKTFFQFNPFWGMGETGILCQNLTGICQNSLSRFGQTDVSSWL